MTKKMLNRRQARWSELLTRFDYGLVYRQGKPNGKADAFTRRPGDLPEGGDERLESMEHVLLKPEDLPAQLRILTNNMVQVLPFEEAYKTDSFSSRILEVLRHGGTTKEITISEFTELDGML